MHPITSSGEKRYSTHGDELSHHHGHHYLHPVNRLFLKLRILHETGVSVPVNKEIFQAVYTSPERRRKAIQDESLRSHALEYYSTRQVLTISSTDSSPESQSLGQKPCIDDFLRTSYCRNAFADTPISYIPAKPIPISSPTSRYIGTYKYLF